ncbi:MAG: FtsX-like permease family protein [Leptospirales bacterium]|nr:FtsX-like permease family protein [Leptospirales bacterium]
MLAFYSILHAFTLRYYARHRLRFAICIVGLVAGVGVAAAINLTNTRIIDSFDSSLTTLSGQTTVSLEPMNGLAPSDLEQLRFAWDYGKFSPYFRTRLSINEQPVQLYGFDFLSETTVRHFEMDLGENGKALLTPGLIVPEDSPLGKKSDTVHVILNGRRLSFPIVGIIRAVDGRLPPRNTAYVDIGHFALFKDRLTGVDFYVPEARKEELTQRLRTLFPYATIRTPNEQKQTTREMLSAFQLNLSALGVIALLVSAYLVYNTVNISVVQREGMLGVLLSLGASPRTIFLAVIFEGMFLGVLGGIPGCALGLVLSLIAHAEVTSTLTSVFRVDAGAAARIEIWPIMISFLIGVLASTLSAWVPAKRAVGLALTTARKQGRSDFKPAGVRFAWIGALAAIPMGIGMYALAILRERPEPGFGAVVAVIVCLSFASPLALLALSRVLRTIPSGATLLAAASTKQHLLKISVATAALALALSMAGSVTIMVASFRTTVEDWLRTVIVADLYLQAGSPESRAASLLDSRVPELLRRLTFVRGVVTLRSAPAFFRDQNIELAANNFTEAARIHGYSFSSGNSGDILVAERENGVLVSEVFANRFHAPRGSTIELFGKRLRVHAVYRNYASERGYILMDEKLFETIVGKRGPNSVAVYLKPDAAPAKAMLDIRRALPEFEISMDLSRDIRQKALAIFDQTFRLTYALQWIAGGIAALAVVTTLTGLVIERRRELTTLLALGATPGRIIFSMILESQVIAVGACVLAVPGSYVLAMILIQVINRYSFGWTIVADLSPYQIFPGFIAACLLSLVAALISVQNLHRGRLTQR